MERISHRTYYPPANKEIKQVKDNDTEEPHVDGNDLEESSFYNKSESIYDIMPRCNDAFMISPDFKPSNMIISKVNSIDKYNCMSAVAIIYA